MYLYVESLIIDPREFENFVMREKSFLRKTGSLGCNALCRICLQSCI